MKTKNDLPVLKGTALQKTVINDLFNQMANLEESQFCQLACDGFKTAIDELKHHDLSVAIWIWFQYLTSGWKGQADTWHEYLKQYNMKYSTAMVKRRIIEYYAIELKLARKKLERLFLEADLKCVDEAIAIINEDNLDEIIEELCTLHRDDMEKSIREKKGKTIESSINDQKVNDILSKFHQLNSPQKKVCLTTIRNADIKGIVIDIHKLNENEFTKCIELLDEAK